MIVEGFESQYMQSKTYLVVEESRGFIVDPAEQDKLIKRVHERGIYIDYIFLTHEHCDHIIGVGETRKQFGAPVICTKACGENISDSRKNYSRYFEAFVALQERFKSSPDLHVEPFSETADEVFEDRVQISWIGHEIELVATPGHSPGSMCILVDNQTLFSGDTLFKNESTMLGFIGGSYQLFEDVTEPWLKSLNKEIIVYPGHLEEFVLGERLNKKVLTGGKGHE